MIDPKDLMFLAEAQGKEIHTNDIDEYGRFTIKHPGFNNSGGFAYQPHKNKEQAFELEEWLCKQGFVITKWFSSNAIWLYNLSQNNGPESWCYQQNERTPQLAITLAAIDYVKETKK